MRAALRGAGLFCLWLVLGAGPGLGDLAMGAVAAALGTWASLRLMPRGHRVRPVALAWLVLCLPVQILVAGTDVALRALSPRPRLAPGLVSFVPRLAGAQRDAFLALSSLLPGTLPAAPGTIHALDVTQPVARDLAAEEARFTRAVRQDG